MPKGYVFTPACHSVHRGVSAPVHAGIHPRADTSLGRNRPGRNPGQTPTWADTPLARHPLCRHPLAIHPHWADTPPADSYCCGRYAFYWNAFVLIFKTPLFGTSGDVCPAFQGQSGTPRICGSVTWI